MSFVRTLVSVCLVNSMYIVREFQEGAHTYLLVKWKSPLSFAWGVGRKCWPSSDVPSSLISMINLHSCLLFSFPIYCVQMIVSKWLPMIPGLVPTLSSHWRPDIPLKILHWVNINSKNVSYSRVQSKAKN